MDRDRNRTRTHYPREMDDVQVGQTSEGQVITRGGVERKQIVPLHKVADMACVLDNEVSERTVGLFKPVYSQALPQLRMRDCIPGLAHTKTGYNVSLVEILCCREKKFGKVQRMHFRTWRCHCARLE